MNIMKTERFESITNAGIVLLSPYLPRLFFMLSLVDGNYNFKDNDARVKAALLLHYIVWRKEEADDSELMVNKLLVGIEISDVIYQKVELSIQEKEAVSSILNAILQNWRKLGDTSIDGLREVFLRREGRIEFIEDSARITVQEKVYDMLIDGIPWDFRMIKHPWMKKPITVQWR